MASGFSYDDLKIQDVGTASNTYKRMIWGDINNQEQNEIASGLLDYCKLDTLAMVEILKHIEGRIISVFNLLKGNET